MIDSHAPKGSPKLKNVLEETCEGYGLLVSLGCGCAPQRRRLLLGLALDGWANSRNPFPSLPKLLDLLREEFSAWNFAGDVLTCEVQLFRYSEFRN